jgi:hypothetical protein
MGLRYCNRSDFLLRIFRLGTREKAAGGILITLNHPTSAMIQEAKSAGFVESALFT